MMLVRTARCKDYPVLQAIEIAAFETLRLAGAMDGPARASSNADLQHYHDEGLLLVCEDEATGPVVGFVGGYRADGWLHVAEMDVHPDWQRRGIGRLLMTAILAAGREFGLAGASLTTDRTAPFNARFYTSLGFRIAEGADCPPRLQEILRAEVEKGLEPDRRVAMVLSFSRLG